MMKKIYLLFLLALLPLVTSAVVKRTINVSTAGTLPDLISDADKHRIQELTLTGKLNGTDIKFIREMAGDSIVVGGLGLVNHHSTNGQLKSLDISKVSIVEGGCAYYYETEYDIDLEVRSFYTSQGSISNNMFRGIPKLEEIILPNSVTSIGGWVFSGSGLTSITIPSNVTSIGYYSFLACNSLKSIIVKPDNSVYDSRNDCNAIIETKSNRLIAGCQTTIIPNGVTRIDGWPFRGCLDLTSIIIPNSVEVIDLYTFLGCNLKDVYCYAENPPGSYVLDEEMFDEDFKANGTLHVPSGTLDKYKSLRYWSDCKNIVADGKVKLNKTKATIEKGKTLTLKATIYPTSLPDKSVKWKSSNTKVATVTSSGKVKGIKAGTATITCTSVATGLSTNCKVTVGYVKLDKTEVTIKKGKTVTLTPTVYPSSLKDKSVIWKSSNTKVATVTSSGKVKGIKAGTATIICTSTATSLSDMCEVTVGYVKLDKTEVSVKKGNTATLKATVYPSSLEDKSVKWKSSNTSVATVTSSGKVKGVKAGTATITCTSVATGFSTTCKVTVGYVKLDKTEVSVKKGNTVTLKATVYPSSLSDKSVTWESSNTKVATVTKSGKVKGIKAGSAAITCTSNATGLSSVCIVTVKASSGSRSLESDEEDDNVTGIEVLEENSAAIEPYDVYDLSGRKVRHQVNSLDGLPAGVYIVNGKKVLKK